MHQLTYTRRCIFSAWENLLRVVKIAKVVKIASQAIATKMLFESKFRMRRFSSDETDLKSKDLEKRQRYEALKKKDLKRRR